MEQYKQYIFSMHWILATVRQNVQNSEYKIQNIVSHNAMHMTWPSIWINQKWYNLNPQGVFCSSWPGEDCIFPENVVGLNLDHWLAHTCIKVFKSNSPPPLWYTCSVPSQKLPVYKIQNNCMYISCHAILLPNTGFNHFFYLFSLDTYWIIHK